MIGRINSLALLAALSGATALAAQTRPPVSAPIRNVRYGVTFTAATAAQRTIHVTMDFDAAGAAPVLLSLPIWTPGAYEVTYFARFVSNFTATSGGTELLWDKLDYDTWRVVPRGAGPVTISFDYRATEFDNAKAWAVDDFTFFNGTNIFLYPEGRLDFPATVTVQTSPGWLVATSMPARGPMTYGAQNYHDLVDMPFFIGRFDLDSQEVSGRWTRLATYPAGALGGEGRRTYWSQIARFIPAQTAIFGDTPWDSYSVLVVFDSTFGGGSALEHQSSHLSLYHPGLMEGGIAASITAHEIVHAWNVKRLRPADLVPYRYGDEQPTTWLWVSEGVTDYYADISMVRSGVADENNFFQNIANKISHVAQVPAVALEDASLQIWIHPTDNTDAIYYDKGSLAGLMLDIMIRDASDNARSLDGVMRELYGSTYRTRFRGFTSADWWGAVSRAAGGRSFSEFNRLYVDGRAAYPWDSILPLAGMVLQADTQRIARMGIATGDTAEGGVQITDITPGGAMDAAGVRAGDVLLRVAGQAVTDPQQFGPRFREQMRGRPDGTPYDVVVRRDGNEMTLRAVLRYIPNIVYRVSRAPNPTEKAARILNGLLTGSAGPR